MLCTHNYAYNFEVILEKLLIKLFVIVPCDYFIYFRLISSIPSNEL